MKVWWINNQTTIFPQIVSAETILFWIWLMYCDLWTIQGRKLFAEIQYVPLNYIIRVQLLSMLKNKIIQSKTCYLAREVSCIFSGQAIFCLRLVAKRICTSAPPQPQTQAYKMRVVTTAVELVWCTNLLYYDQVKCKIGWT